MQLARWFFAQRTTVALIGAGASLFELLTIHAAPGELSAPPAAQRLDLSTALINALKFQEAVSFLVLTKSAMLPCRRWNSGTAATPHSSGSRSRGRPRSISSTQRRPSPHVRLLASELGSLQGNAYCAADSGVRVAGMQCHAGMQWPPCHRPFFRPSIRSTPTADTMLDSFRYVALQYHPWDGFNCIQGTNGATLYFADVQVRCHPHLMCCG
jgi:hypothetical protein